MLLQRLIVDRKGGFNYDYMGVAEYEFGATREARMVLAKLAIEKKLRGKLVMFTELTPRGEAWGEAISCHVFGEVDHIASLPTDLKIKVSKEFFHTDRPDIQGWLQVHGGDKTIFIIRATPENLTIGSAFMAVFVDGILKDEAEAKQRELYTYANGYTLRRVEGPVYLPQNDGIPVEGNGQWVLFNENNQAIDRDKYHNDIIERHHHKIGEPLPTDD